MMELTNFDTALSLVLKEIEKRGKYLNDREARIDLMATNSGKVINYLKLEREFLSNMLAFISQTENYVKELEYSNIHLKAQNTIYCARHDAIEKLFIEEFGNKIEKELGI